MTTTYILDQGPTNAYNAVTHFAMPAGTNSAGVTWQVCYLAWVLARLGTTPKTALTIGSGAGQILQADADQIIAGNVVEVPFTFGDDPAVIDKNALIDLLSSRAISEFQSTFAARFKYYGYTRP